MLSREEQVCAPVLRKITLGDFVENLKAWRHGDTGDVDLNKAMEI